MAVLIQVLDSRPVVARGLVEILSRRGDPKPWALVCGQQEEKQADLALVSSLFDGDGLALLERWHQDGNGPAFIVVTEDNDPGVIARSIVWGARNCLSRTSSARHFVEAVRRAVAGKTPPPPSTFLEMRAWMQETPSPPDPPVGGARALLAMTARESQVWRHLGLGLGNREIALSLGVTVETVKEYVQNILRKLNAGDRTHAGVLAIRAGIATPPQPESDRT